MGKTDAYNFSMPFTKMFLVKNSNFAKRAVIIFQSHMKELAVLEMHISRREIERREIGDREISREK